MIYICSKTTKGWVLNLQQTTATSELCVHGIVLRMLQRNMCISLVEHSNPVICIWPLPWPYLKLNDDNDMCKLLLVNLKMECFVCYTHLADVMLFKNHLLLLVVLLFSHLADVTLFKNHLLLLIVLLFSPVVCSFIVELYKQLLYSWNKSGQITYVLHCFA